MQVRDSKAFSMDLLFPVIIIVVGIVLASTQFFSEDTTHELSAFDYPTPLYFVENDYSPDIPDRNRMKEYYDRLLYSQDRSAMTSGETI